MAGDHETGVCLLTLSIGYDLGPKDHISQPHIMFPRRTAPYAN